MNDVARAGANPHREEKDLIHVEFLARTPYCTSALANLLGLPIRCTQATRSPASFVEVKGQPPEARAQNESFMFNLERKKLWDRL